MRLFTGIDLPVQVRNNLGRLVSRLRPAARVNWSSSENLHITTKFIGEWPEERLPELVTALGDVPREGPIPIAVRELGWFPRSRSPKVFWAGIQADAALARLASNTEQRLSALGIAVETRSFSPHLTLARIKQPVLMDGLSAAVAALDSEEFGKFAADRFYLYLSERGRAGSVYTKLEEFLLTGS